MNILSSSRQTKTFLTETQRNILKCCYCITPFPSSSDRISLSGLLNLKPRTIQIWFQNERQKNKLDTPDEGENMFSRIIDLLLEVSKILY